MKKRTRNIIITACVAVVAAAAVLVGVFVIRPMVTEKKIHVKDTDDYYHEEVPLTGDTVVYSEAIYRAGRRPAGVWRTQALREADTAYRCTLLYFSGRFW